MGYRYFPGKVCDGINDFWPSSTMGEVTSHAIYDHKFGTGYIRCRILAALYKDKRIISPLT